MARMWIVVGDATSSGGRVITGSPFTDIDGKPVARVNDQATCPLHKGAFPIVDGDSTIIIDGQPVALHGSSLACGCKVIAVQQPRVFVDAGENSPGRTATPLDSRSGASSTGQTTQFDEAFVLTSAETGEPLRNRRYRMVRQDGSYEFGTTDQRGATQVVVSECSERIEIELEEEGP